jgi:CheY-like chemotaxis protein
MAGLDRTNRLAAALQDGDVPLVVLSVLESRAPGGGAPPPAGQRPDQAQLLQHVQQALTASGRRRVLVIEDDESIRQLLTVALRKQEFEVLDAPDGETGLALAGQAQPELVVLDLRLPGIDGFAVLQALKRSPATAGIPVIAVTGSEGLLLGARARVLSLGAADFVAKPFEMDALIDEIRTLMHEREGVAENADPSASR